MKHILVILIVFVTIKVQSQSNNQRIIGKNCITNMNDTLMVLNESIIKKDFTEITSSSTFSGLQNKFEHLDWAKEVISNECFFKYLDINSLSVIFGEPSRIDSGRDLCSYHYFVDKNGYAVIFSGFKYGDKFFIVSVRGYSIC